MGLVLARREDEAILIGGNVIVRVVSIEGGTVRIHVTAPPDVAIIREELASVEPRTKRTEKVSGQDQSQGQQAARPGRVSGAFGFPAGVGDAIAAAERGECSDIGRVDDGFGTLAGFDDEFCDE